MKNRKKWQIALLLCAGIMMSSCQSSTKKTAQNVAKIHALEDTIKKEKKIADDRAIKTALLKEWKTFKDESELDIIYHELQISEFRNNMRTIKIRDTLFENNVNLIEQRCADMKLRIIAYDKNQSDFQVFKRSFSYDLEQIDFAIEFLKNKYIKN